MKRSIIRLFTALLVLGAASPIWAAPAGDAIMPLDQYTTTKSRNLASLYRPQLMELREDLDHCLPWVSVQPNGIGFRQPKGAETDDRYLSVWILIAQHDNGQFGALPQSRRASAMFSRYGVDMLRRMVAIPGLLGDANVQGFSVVLSWLKPTTNGRSDGQPVNETLALFVDKGTALGYLSRSLPATEFVKRSRFVVFDGKDEVGRLPLEVWEDAFVSTFRAKDSKPARNHKCS